MPNSTASQSCSETRPFRLWHTLLLSVLFFAGGAVLFAETPDRVSGQVGRRGGAQEVAIPETNGPTRAASAFVADGPSTFSPAPPEYSEEQEEGQEFVPGTCGVERWAVKTGTDADATLIDQSAVTASTVQWLGAIPRPGSIPESNRVIPTETTIWQVHATLTLYKLETDSDYHLVLDDGAGHTMIAEIAAASCVAPGGPFEVAIARARAQFDARYTPTGSFQIADVPVRITGIGFFDFDHGQTGRAPNVIELHPVLDILFYPTDTPPEVSADGAAIPFTLHKVGAGVTFEFEYLGTASKYHVYGAPDQASMDAGTWVVKVCDLEHNPLGTWATDNATYASWTLADMNSLPEDHYVIVQENAGVEGPYGHKSDGTPIHPDADQSTPTNVGCDLICTANSATITGVDPDTTVVVGTPQTFHGTGTGEGPLTYDWDFHYNGTTFNVEATGQDPTFTYAAIGTYVTALRVTDDCPAPSIQQSITTVGITVNATPCGPIVVISQVYGGGGNSGSVYKNDFIEIFNRGDQSQSLAGWSVQYASAGGSSWSVTTLSGGIPTGGYYLIREAPGTGGTTDLPTPDATGNIAMSATQGRVALVSSTTTLSGTCPSGSMIKDFVGYGAANCYEGRGPAPTLSNLNSDRRDGSGCTDTNDNQADFSAVISDTSHPPRNSETPRHPCTCP